MSYFMTKKEATIHAERVKEMLGDEWEIKVWNNQEWCFKVSLDNNIHVRPATTWEDKPKYFVMIGKCSAQLAIFSTDQTNYNEDPVEAVREAVEAYEEKLNAFIEEQRAIVQSGISYLIRKKLK